MDKFKQCHGLGMLMVSLAALFLLLATGCFRLAATATPTPTEVPTATVPPTTAPTPPK